MGAKAAQSGIPDPDTYDYGDLEVRNLGDSRAWSLLETETAIEPQIPIVDAHHHFYLREDGSYMLPELVKDIRSGHDIRATVFVECGVHYRKDAPIGEAPLGETEFAVRMGQDAEKLIAPGECRVCSGIVGFADLMLGDKVRPVLEQHVELGAGRFRGIRNRVTWDRHGVGMHNRPFTEGMLNRPEFRKGFAHLGALGLSFDAWQYHTQLDELVSVARQFPDTRIVVNHIGAPLGVGPYAARQSEVIAAWQASLKALAALDNVVVKIGGLGIVIFGFGFPFRATPPNSVEMSQAWRSHFDFVLESFGPYRCILESNFPADQQSFNYVAVWNAFKRLTRDLSADERRAMFHDNAVRVYRLESAS
jgi:L-fuconolactonase